MAIRYGNMEGIIHIPNLKHTVGARATSIVANLNWSLLRDRYANVGAKKLESGIQSALRKRSQFALSLGPSLLLVVAPFATGFCLGFVLPPFSMVMTLSKELSSNKRERGGGIG